MYWQRSYIERNLSLGATSGTKTIDLPKSALLSQLLIRLTATNNGTSNRNNHIHDKISKIEVIVDGSTVVKSLSGLQAQALAFFNSKRLPATRIHEGASQAQWEEFPLYFGRFPGDLEYGLDTKKVINPQLKITWNTTGAGASATDLFSTSTYPVLDVLVEQLLEPEAAVFDKGYIKAHEITTWAPTANAEEKRVELPVGNKYKAAYVRCYATAWEPRQALDNVYLDLNVGVSQPFKMDEAEWRAWNREIYGEIELTGVICTMGGVWGREFAIAYMRAYPGIAQGNYFISSGGGSGCQFSVMCFDHNAAEKEDVDVFHIAKGELYHQFFALPFDYPDNRFMIDSSKWSDVDLVLKAASSGIATILPSFYVVLEEVISR